MVQVARVTWFWGVFSLETHGQGIFIYILQTWISLNMFGGYSDIPPYKAIKPPRIFSLGKLEPNDLFSFSCPFCLNKRPTNPWLAPSICAADASRWCQSSSPRLVMQSDGQVKAIDLSDDFEISTVWRSSRLHPDWWNILPGPFRKKFARFLKLMKTWLTKTSIILSLLKGVIRKKKPLKGTFIANPFLCTCFVGSRRQISTLHSFCGEDGLNSSSWKKIPACGWMSE